ncbi:hypothetical protein [Stygiobacter electus]|uniref:Lipoprotein n=1 Tax=Stygiobacter electus TaxID=3032292 RepID=A0AAE3P3V4_9BACT|nr:hypothetical protein [Stygiobacter electus]MDF1612698.1 hypothetical protein [Stygiobacter electus]
MKSRYSLHLILSLLLFVFITSCKEEVIVEQKNENNSYVQSILAKGSDLSSVQEDSTIQQKKKKRVKRLKKEHEKPYVVIEKPENLLSEKLKSRSINKSLSKSSNSFGFNSAQSTQSCDTMEVDVWH